ncbi:uncharacterized protein RAG0_02933 [Rhynchosporium agropyri]|uniref:Uncharacterized protein n=1 Tax=Rhynchosporium agropyri TaxID=914238 RepID=A0A1E1K304_9HELO|nr:uncharacterized protein RAG0_02933 [Rhynchosporium agropyri]
MVDSQPSQILQASQSSALGQMSDITTNSIAPPQHGTSQSLSQLALSAPRRQHIVISLIIKDNQDRQITTTIVKIVQILSSEAQGKLNTSLVGACSFQSLLLDKFWNCSIRALRREGKLKLLLDSLDQTRDQLHPSSTAEFQIANDEDFSYEIVEQATAIEDGQQRDIMLTIIYLGAQASVLLPTSMDTPGVAAAEPNLLNAQKLSLLESTPTPGPSSTGLDNDERSDQALEKDANSADNDYEDEEDKSPGRGSLSEEDSDSAEHSENKEDKGGNEQDDEESVHQRKRKRPLRAKAISISSSSDSGRAPLRKRRLVKADEMIGRTPRPNQVYRVVVPKVIKQSHAHATGTFDMDISTVLATQYSLTHYTKKSESFINDGTIGLASLPCARQGPKDINYKVACTFIGITDDHDGDFVHQLAGFKEGVRIAQHQLHGAVWLMYHNRKLGFGILADEQGSGKTVTILVWYIFERELGVLHSEIAKSRKLKDGRHCIEGDTNSTYCPSQGDRTGWIMCPCYLGSPTSSMLAMPGVRYVCGSPGQVAVWKNEFIKFIDTTDPNLALQLIDNVSDQSSPYRYSNVLDQLKTRRWERNHEAGAGDEDWEAGEAAQENQDRFLLVGNRQNHKAFQEKFRWHCKKRGARVPGASKAKSVHKTNTAWGEREFTGIMFGMLLVDEFHAEAVDGRITAMELFGGRYGLSIPWDCFRVAISATPFQGTIAKMQRFFAICEQKDYRNKQGIADFWATSRATSELSQLSAGNIKRTIIAIKQLMETEDMQADTANKRADIANIIATIIETVFLRRTIRTNWRGLGRPIVLLPPHTHIEVELEYEPEPEYAVAMKRAYEASEKAVQTAYKLRVAAWESLADKKLVPMPKSVSAKVVFNQHHKSLICSTLPALAKYLEAGLVDLTWAQIISQQWDRKNLQSSPYVQHLAEIVNTSAKFQFIRSHFVDKIQQGSDDWNDKNSHGCSRHKKLFIASDSPVIAYILGLAWELWFSETSQNATHGKYAVIASNIPLKDREELIANFQEAIAGENAYQPNSEPTYTLISTYGLMGESYTLTRASTVILVTPAYHEDIEKQVIARVTRMGAKAVTESITLSVGSAVEIRIKKVKAAGVSMIEQAMNTMAVRERQAGGGSQGEPIELDEE